MSYIISKLSDIQIQLLQKKNKYLGLSAFFGLFLVFLVVFFVFLPTGEIMAETGYEIFDFQLTWSSRTMDDILNSWSEIFNVVIYQTLADYIFILGNVIFAVSVFLLLSKNLINQRLKQINKGTMWISLIVGIFDGIENIFTIWILMNPSNFPSFLVILISFFASLKFIFLILEYLIMSGSLVFWVIEIF